MKKKNRKNQFLALTLALSLGIMPVDSSVFAASDFISDTQDNNITDNTQDFEVEGTDGVGEVLASAISEENKNSEERRLSADNITGLEIEDNTAVVEFQTVTDAELVVAVYDEQQLQMLASGNEYVSEDDNTAEITISGDMPQYFVATAYLLDEESHEPLCDAYTTELYTKNIQDLRNSTVDDYEPEKVLQLEEGNEETNFAVFNDQTVTAEEGTASNQLIDNGNGTYTITNADSSFTELKEGDTFSYRYSDGTVLLGKVAAISVNGTTVTIQKEADTDLEDYFDYVKIETDSSQGEWSVDNSNMEDGVTAAETDTDAEMFADRAARIEGSGSLEYSTSYNLYKKFDNDVKVTGNLNYKFKFKIDFYITAGYQYFSTKLEYTTGISVKVEGKLKLKEIPLGKIQWITPLLCVIVKFTPSFVVEASGSLTWKGELKGSIGGAYDANSGFKNLASRPTVDSSLEIEGKLFVGLKAKPSISIISAELALSFTGGAELSAKKAIYDTGKDEIHTCKLCLQGEINAKFTMELEVDIIKGVVNRKRAWDLPKIKVKDFYYSIDRGEFGWSTCPHIAYAVNVTVKDKDGKETKGTSILTVGDRKTAEQVKIVTPKGNVDSVEATDSKQTKIYLPNGSYVVQATQGKVKGEANLTVHSRGTQVEIKLSKKAESGGTGTGDQASGKDGNITWRLTEDGTLYIEGKGDMPDYYHSEEAPWSDFKINKAIVGKGLTSIGDFAFYKCSSLSSIELPEELTSIGDFAFFECSSLSSIELPEELTSIGVGALESCSSLTSIELPEGVTSIGHWAFCDCSSLSSIKIPEGVTSIVDSAFCDCSSLSSIKIPEGVTSIGDGAFWGCSSLSSIKIPEGVTSIGPYAFYRCSSLSSIEIPGNVSEIGYCVFEGCELLKSVYFKGNKPFMDKNEDEDYKDKEYFLTGFSDATIYYPQNNSTWDGIESEELGGTNIKWVPYDPASLSTALAGTEAVDDANLRLPESQTEEAEFTDDINSFEVDDSEADIFVEEEENVEEVQDPASSSDQNEMTIEEEDESNAFESEDIEITELAPPTSNAQEETKTGASMMFSKLVPHSRYLFVMVKDENADNLLEASNLLYIGEKAADETGTVSFRYMLRENFESPVSKVFGADLKEISNMKVALSETSYTYDGKAKTPSVRVQDDGYLLQAGADYNVTYSNNRNVGKATVTITGTGNYTGSISINFEIKKASNVIKAAAIIKNVSGKTQTVKINAKVNDGAKLTYSSNNKSVKVNAKGKVTIARKFTGKAVITITAAETGKYKKTSTHITVTVRPSGTSLSGLSNKSKGRVKVSWKRNKAVTGYRIQYSTDKKFKKGVKNVNVNKNKTTTATLAKLKKGKTYYVRIATYKKVGEKIYSSWSKAKKIRIKK